MRRNEAKARPGQPWKMALLLFMLKTPLILCVYYKGPSAPFSFCPPPSSPRIFTISRAVLHIFPWAANVFPREIHWQGNCMKADRPREPTRWWRGPGRRAPSCPKIGQHASQICWANLHSSPLNGKDLVGWCRPCLRREPRCEKTKIYLNHLSYPTDLSTKKWRRSSWRATFDHNTVRPG